MIILPWSALYRRKHIFFYDSLGRHCFERDFIEEWIIWLKDVRHSCPETCNIRLGSLRAFLEFLGNKEIGLLYLYQEAKLIKRQKCQKRKVEGLTREAVAAILAAPDPSTRTGKRDLVFLTLLYATAARLDEILSIRLSHLYLIQISLTSTCTARVTRYGRRTFFQGLLNISGSI